MSLNTYDQQAPPNYASNLPPVESHGNDEQREKKPAPSSALDDLADLEDLMEGGSPGNGSVHSFLREAFCLVFKDNFT